MTQDSPTAWRQRTPGRRFGRSVHPQPSRTAKNTKQHKAFLEQVTGADLRHYLAWFDTLPLWLDLDGLRVVHACWHEESMEVVRQHCGAMAPFADHLVDANNPQLPEETLPADDRPFVYTGDVPVCYGHYWRQGSPELGDDYTDRTACVDFSAVNGGALTAYRWSVGDDTIRRKNYVQLQ